MALSVLQKRLQNKGNLIEKYVSDRGCTIKIYDKNIAGKTREECLASVNAKSKKFKFSYKGES